MTLLSVAEVAIHLGVSRQTINRLISRNELRVLRIGSRVLIRPADLADFVDRRVESGEQVNAA